MRQCGVCGASFTRGEAVCPYCGSDLVPGARSAEEKKDFRAEEGVKASGKRFSAFRDAFGQARESGQAEFRADSCRVGGNPPPLDIFSRYPRRRAHDLISALLAFSLGTFGAHWFYRGNLRRAVLYCAFCWTGIPTIAGFVEGISFLRRAADDSPPPLNR